jgi:hypothetical protein
MLLQLLPRRIQAGGQARYHSGLGLLAVRETLIGRLHRVQHQGHKPGDCNSGQPTQHRPERSPAGAAVCT